MTVIRQQDFIDSIEDSLQFISYYHPLDYVKAVEEADETCGEVLRDPCALTLGDEPLAGGVEHHASELWVTPAQECVAFDHPVHAEVREVGLTDAKVNNVAPLRGKRLRAGQDRKGRYGSKT